MYLQHFGLKFDPLGKSNIIELARVLPLYNVGYIAAGTPKSLTFSQN